MDKVLLVEDATFFGSLIEKKLSRDMALDVVWVKSKSEAVNALTEQEDFTLALLDLTLPDADGTDIVELVRRHGVPSIVFSGTYEREIRDEVLRLGVIDYIIKENQASLNYLFSTVSRVLLNRSRTVMVVEDSAPIRHTIVNILQRFQLNVIAVDNGAEALTTFMMRPEISLVLTDYDMPEMNGIELTKALYRESLQRKFAIIGLSAVTDTDVRIQFIKSGANDFMTKPFEVEELFCRISQNLNFLDQLELLHQQANFDFLTGLYNRRYFFETSKSKLAQAARSEEVCALMIIDIDNFKPVNDSYGHDAGDRVLVDVAARLGAGTRQSDVLARMGGEEFCKLFIAPDVGSLGKLALNMLSNIGNEPFAILDGEIPVTISIGVAYDVGANLDQLIDAADDLLYQAKNSGRNRAVIAPALGGGEPQVVQGPTVPDKPYVDGQSVAVHDWR